MKLKIPIVTEPFDLLSEDKVNMLVIENQAFFTQLLTDLSNQINFKETGKAVLFQDNEIIEMSSAAEIITQFIPFEINSKTFLTKLHNKIKSIMFNEEFYINTQQLLAQCFEHIKNIIDYSDLPLDTERDFDISYILKGAGLKFRTEFNSLSEQLLEYMLVSSKLGCEKLFILINIRNYIPDNEIDLFYKSILYSKHKVLIISAVNYPVSEYEKKVIIDKDLCVI